MTDIGLTTFILEESQGFTGAGIDRLQEPITTYINVILGSEAEMSTTITGRGRPFSAQKQFLGEVVITFTVDLQRAVQGYQNYLSYASSELDYGFGYNLYLAPSDMQFHIVDIKEYSKLLV